jgi:hypothetical protein
MPGRQQFVAMRSQVPQDITDFVRRDRNGQVMKPNL